MNVPAYCAFNVFNVETIRGIAEAAEELASKVYLQTSPSVVRTFGANRLSHLLSLFTSDLDSSRLILHLDHCTDIDLIGSCIDNGWHSVMIDGSSLSLEKNIELTRKVVAMAHQRGVLVEGELGNIAGQEDDLEHDGGTLANPDDAEVFVRETNIDLLAIGIGNKHGYYRGNDYNLRFDLLLEVHKRLPETPLVLHGGTGILPEDISTAVRYGVRKINFSTELKDCFLKAAMDHALGPKKHDMGVYYRVVVAAIKSYAMGKISFLSGVTT